MYHTQPFVLDMVNPSFPYWLRGVQSNSRGYVIEKWLNTDLKTSEYVLLLYLSSKDIHNI